MRRLRKLRDLATSADVLAASSSSRDQKRKPSDLVEGPSSSSILNVVSFLEEDYASDDDVPLKKRPRLSAPFVIRETSSSSSDSPLRTPSVSTDESLPHLASDMEISDSEDWAEFDLPQAYEPAKTRSLGTSSSQPIAQTSLRTAVQSDSSIPSNLASNLDPPLEVLPDDLNDFNSAAFDDKLYFTRYKSQLSRPILTGAYVDFDSIDAWHFYDLFQFQGWTDFLTLTNNTYILPTRCFYANLRKEQHNSFSTYFRGLRFTFSAQDVSELINAPNSGLDIYDYTLSSFSFPRHHSLEEASNLLFSVVPMKIDASTNLSLTPSAKFMANLLSKTVLPKAGSRASFTGCHLVLTYCILKRIKVNLPLLILKVMGSIQSKGSALGFGKVISLLLSQNGIHVSSHTIVTPDSHFTKKNASLAKLQPPVFPIVEQQPISSSISSDSSDHDSSQHVSASHSSEHVSDSSQDSSDSSQHVSASSSSEHVSGSSHHSSEPPCQTPVLDSSLPDTSTSPTIQPICPSIDQPPDLAQTSDPSFPIPTAPALIAPPSTDPPPSLSLPPAPSSDPPIISATAPEPSVPPTTSVPSVSQTAQDPSVPQTAPPDVPRVTSPPDVAGPSTVPPSKPVLSVPDLAERISRRVAGLLLPPIERMFAQLATHLHADLETNFRLLTEIKDFLHIPDSAPPPPPPPPDA